ncbi:Hypothetical glutamic acid-rich region containing protein [Heterostelium album PN500]|uniref:U3 small nucleolar RNA-associated protein 25 n=1 Tax=Heterostelium pallidum (strain ATCC 26659 / Pp 5 / PN500) TaxID=670386 RepID=D3B3U0_HETP5|nr:Hypothetical glutamic acid-rich region containing protein [Heterostelium album PN500]EFA83988.1 Hypothetical glutamic acid-rich region containing protein [Heterostelium album PN500]|eukprot:XP_020436105.1 Hypothetical glutamic acid-rich region containing protein [Heterostelium album PN500]
MGNALCFVDHQKMKKNFKHQSKYSKKLSKKYSTHRLYYSDNIDTFKALDPKKKNEEKHNKLLDLSNRYHEAHQRKEQDEQERERQEIIDQLREHTNDQVEDRENFTDIFELGASSYDKLLNSFGGADSIKKRTQDTLLSNNASKKKQKLEQRNQQQKKEEVNEEEEEEDEEEVNNDEIDIEFDPEEEEEVEVDGDEQDDDDDVDQEELEEEEQEEVEEGEEEEEEESEFADVYGDNKKEAEEEEEEIVDEKEVKEILKDNKKQSNDICFNHFNREIETENQLEDLQTESHSFSSQSVDVESFGIITSSGCPAPLNNQPVAKSVMEAKQSFIPSKKNNFSEYNIKSRLLKPWSTTKKNKENDLYFTPIQQSLFPIMNEYRDLLFSEENHKNHKSIYQLYTLHAVNHVLKTRDQLLKDNVITKEFEKKNEIVPDLRHQGFTKPKVLIVVPFRNTALDIIKLMLKLVPHEPKTQTEKKTKLVNEYSAPEGKTLNPEKPEDFQHIFRDNIDDCFRIGIGFNRNGIKLFTPFFFSDIIIASPLGLRLVVGTKGDAQRDYDFLSSIEVLIIDQVDTILQQNWDHINIIFENLNLIPRAQHNTDFSRVRMSYLEGWSKHLRQTLIFGSLLTPEINSIYNRQCYNINGKIRVKRIKDGEISNIINPSLVQTFHKVYISADEHKDDDSTARFQFFIDTVLPKLTHHSTESRQILIYIPSYFEFTRIRNYFNKEAKSFVKCDEYAQPGAITRARHYFRRGERTYMLFTERFHFFNRYKIQGIKHVVFFGLPQIAAYYSEVLNMITQQDGTVMALYTNRDRLALERIVGTIRSTKMLESEKSTHLFC